jgi:dihydroorotate dehydrogenase electron transfer subunit
MQITDAHVIERRRLAPGRVLLWLSAPEVSRGARPGQFLMVRATPTLDPFLSRAFWIHRLRDGADGEELALLVDVVGRGSGLIAGAVPGQTLTVLGPLGRPLTPAPGVRSLLLIAEGIGIAPLVWLADEETARGRSVTLLIGAPTSDGVYPLELLAPEVEVAVATEDGSLGAAGSVGALVPEYAGWADQIVAAGSDRLYRELAGVLRAQMWRRPCRVLANAPVPCGTGVCRGCGVTVRRGRTLLVCRDGPAMDLRDLSVS